MGTFAPGFEALRWSRERAGGSSSHGWPTVTRQEGHFDHADLPLGHDAQPLAEVARVETLACSLEGASGLGESGLFRGVNSSLEGSRDRYHSRRPFSARCRAHERVDVAAVGQLFVAVLVHHGVSARRAAARLHRIEQNGSASVVRAGGQTRAHCVCAQQFSASREGQRPVAYALHAGAGGTRRGSRGRSPAVCSRRLPAWSRRHRRQA